MDWKFLHSQITVICRKYAGETQSSVGNVWDIRAFAPDREKSDLKNEPAD